MRKALVAICIALLCLVAAFGWARETSAASQADQLNRALRRADAALKLATTQQTQRHAAAIDTCHTLQGILRIAAKTGPTTFNVQAVTKHGHHLTLRVTLPHPKNEAQHEIKTYGLGNCQARAQRETHGG